eukprot:TRINITY_DN871_c0_g1_i3.p1 TRINITY_DN871_c0_g1~~TRINITY_DN871_c0_g1_i3.p1  ORF type:complete len:302 (-),score=108.58 TRINITY_DN871_c0_g1_i3:200-1105(-)
MCIRDRYQRRVRGRSFNMGCFQSTLLGAVPIDKFLRDSDTGDLILFDNNAKLTYVTKCFTRSKWDHVGMILKYSDNPDERILIESAGCGVFLCYAKQRVQQCIEDGTVLGYRKLNNSAKPMSDKLRKRIHEEAQAQVDKPYEQCFGEILKAVLSQDGFETPLKLMQSMGFSWAEKGEDLDSLFCSELVAHLLKTAEILPKLGEAQRDSNMFLPKDFSSASNAICPVIKPWSYWTEKHVVKTEGEAAVTASKQGATQVDLGGKKVTIADMMARGQEQRVANEARFKEANWASLTSMANPASV